MKSLLAVALLLPYIAAPLVCGVACGGGEGAQEGPQAPAGSSASASSAAAGPGSPSDGASAGPTTTSSSLGDAGDTQGVKLAETHTGTAAPASASPAPKAPPHTHDAGRGPADIRALVVAHRDEARACYDRSLADHPGIEGDIVVTWTIDPKGNVTGASLDSSRSQIAEPTLVACLADIIKKIQFAPSTGGFETKAFYPFNFHPHHQRSAQ
jgi:hypothetical protein